jgi:hypothetical protein
LSLRRKKDRILADNISMIFILRELIVKSKSIFSLTIIFLVIICTQVSCNQNQFWANGTEEWACYQIRDNGIADFTSTIDDKNKRVLRGEFISALLTRRIHPIFTSEISYQDIVIKNAVIRGNVFLTNQTISFPLIFLNCHFESDFQITHTIFEKIVIFNKLGRLNL